MFAYGDAGFLGAMDAGKLPAPVSAIAAPASGGGYWLLGRDGQVCAVRGLRLPASLWSQRLRC